jgi:hypothetical protein
VREFRRSAVYAIVGLFVVAGITVAIGLSAGNDADPKLQYGLIFAVLGVFLIGLFFFQSGDLGAATRGDSRAIAAGARDVDDPTKLSSADLWAALAVKPIDKEAAEARGEMWGAAKRSMHLGMIVCVLIFLTVPPIYLLDTFVTLYIGVPLIIAVAIYGSIRAVGSGGEVDQGFERLDRSMAPLGLHLVERPDLRWEARPYPMWGADARLRGPLILEGKRNGRSVSLNQEERTSLTVVKASTPTFGAKARDGRIRADSGAPETVTAVLDALPRSTGWKGVKVRGGPGTIEVERKGDPSVWLRDLWLAERLAEAL